MVDRLDQQILETIANAPSLVRTVTRREIEAGVLFPSATAFDIRRNLSENIPLNLVESRLNSLDGDGYIFFNEGRWWLTKRGRTEVGRERVEPESSIHKPVRALLQETFVKHQQQEPKTDVDDTLSRLSEIYSNPKINGEERSKKVKEILSLLHPDLETREYLESRANSLDTEVKQLESELTKKKLSMTGLESFWVIDHGCH